MSFLATWRYDDVTEKNPPPVDPRRGEPPFYKLVLPPRKEAEYAAIGVPEERKPLGHAPLDFCPRFRPGELVADKNGRWCIVVDD